MEKNNKRSKLFHVETGSENAYFLEKNGEN